MSSSHPVLVVEDDVDVREAMVQVLESAGHAAVSAGDGEEALARLDGGLTPCLILLDLMMPRMNGWQFLEQQAVRQSNAPIIVVSAHGTGDDVRSAGVAAYMRKPVDVDQLLGVIARHCGQ